MEKQKNIPQLRFREFSQSWEEKKLGEIGSFFSGGTPLTSKRSFYSGDIPFIRSGEIHSDMTEMFISEEGFNNSSAKMIEVGDLIYALYGATSGEAGISQINGAINQAILCIRTNLDNRFLLNYLDLNKENILATYIQGGQGNLSAEIIKSLFIPITELKEQQKIASFLTAVDEKIQALKKKKTVLEQYKKGIVQKLFSQELRFQDDEGNDFPKWEMKKLGEVLIEHKLKSSSKEEVYSVSVHKGLINQIEHLGRSFAAENTDNYNLVQPNDIVYTKSPTGDFPFGIIKQSKIQKPVIVSPLYGVFTPESKGLGYLLNVYFESPLNVANYLGSLIQKGAKNTINITNSTFLSKKMNLPISIDEQEKIGDFLFALDEKINRAEKQIQQTQAWKKGLLQKMFV